MPTAYCLPHFIFALYFILCFGDLLESGEKGTSTGAAVQGRGWNTPQQPYGLGVLFRCPSLDREHAQEPQELLPLLGSTGVGTTALGRH